MALPSNSAPTLRATGPFRGACRPVRRSTSPTTAASLDTSRPLISSGCTPGAGGTQQGSVPRTGGARRSAKTSASLKVSPNNAVANRASARIPSSPSATVAEVPTPTSRPGARPARALTPASPRALAFRQWSRTGMRNASVFPEPVPVVTRNGRRATPALMARSWWRQRGASPNGQRAESIGIEEAKRGPEEALVLLNDVTDGGRRGGHHAARSAARTPKCFTWSIYSPATTGIAPRCICSIIARLISHPALPSHQTSGQGRCAPPDPFP